MLFPLESIGMKKAATVSQVLMVRPFCLKLSGSKIVYMFNLTPRVLFFYIRQIGPGRSSV
jgi:hypothetical protein